MAYDLERPLGRLAAQGNLLLKDHGVFRLLWDNRHTLPGGLIRSNQPAPYRLARLKAEGVKTILNLRGANDDGTYALEAAACRQLGLTLIDFKVRSRDMPSVETIREARRIFDTMAYPALMHCKSGADRAGFMAVLYRHFRLGETIAEALPELSLRYGHIRQGKTGLLDHFFEAYVAADAERPIAFMDWVETVYDREALKAEFMASWWANVLVERVLRRE